MAKRKTPKKRIKYTNSHIFQLCTGHDFFRDAFGDGPEAMEQMRKAWPLLRERAIEYHEERLKRKLHPESMKPMPWAYYQFER